jgi:hypothetical protein
MIWPVRFSDWAIIVLLVMLAAMMFYLVKVLRASAAKDAQPTFLEEGRRQSELMTRQADALERIASALEKPGSPTS